MVKHKMLPMPDANVGEVLGLVEIIYAYGEKVKISFLAEELRMQLDDLGDAIDMAELLNLVTVKSGEVQLTVFGEALNLGTIDNKKEVLRKKLPKLEPFRSVLRIIKKHGSASRKDILGLLRGQGMIIEDEGRFHKLLLTWGGYAEIFEYDGARQVFRPIDKPIHPHI
ncbi:MAG: AAA-associated domain-containing protein [Candidatus Micrarchaeia archaeon]